MEELEETRRRAGLCVEDLRADAIPIYVAPEKQLQVGEGKKTLSWIWYTVSNEELNGTSRDVEQS